MFADDQPYTRKSSTLLGLGKGSGREAGGVATLHYTAERGYFCNWIIPKLCMITAAPARSKIILITTEPATLDFLL